MRYTRTLSSSRYTGSRKGAAPGTVRLTVSFEEDVFQRLHQHCTRTGDTMSGAVSKIVEAHLAELQKTEAA